MIPFHYFNHLVFIQRKMSLSLLVINTNTGTVMLVRKTTLNLFGTVREWKHISVVSESPPSGRFCLVQGLQYPDCYSSLCINTAWKQTGYFPQLYWFLLSPGQQEQAGQNNGDQEECEGQTGEAGQNSGLLNHLQLDWQPMVIIDKVDLDLDYS